MPMLKPLDSVSACPKRRLGLTPGNLPLIGPLFCRGGYVIQKGTKRMRNVIYAATGHGYRVQVIDGGEVVYEYSAGNHQMESQAVIDPSSPHAVNLRQLKRWAKQTAHEIAKERRILASSIEYDADLEAALQDIFCLIERTEQ